MMQIRKDSILRRFGSFKDVQHCIIYLIGAAFITLIIIIIAVVVTTLRFILRRSLRIVSVRLFFM